MELSEKTRKTLSLGVAAFSGRETKPKKGGNAVRKKRRAMERPEKSGPSKVDLKGTSKGKK